MRSLLAYFQRRTRDPEVAADLTAETFAAALAARGRFGARPVPASVWLFAYRETPDGIDGASGAQVQGGLSGRRTRQIATILNTGPMPATLEPVRADAP